MLKKVIRSLFNWKATVLLCILLYFWYSNVLNTLPTLLYQDRTLSNAKSFEANNDGIIIPTFATVNVNVNFVHKFKGLIVNNELYVPFQFLKQYYEVYGSFDKVEPGHSLQFTWLNAAPDILNPKQLNFLPYSAQKTYLNFHETDVANRARVKCICGKYEVPITVQWDPKGYYYPTQVAQYGLSHMSKFYFENDKRKDHKEYVVLMQLGKCFKENCMHICNI